MNHSVFERIILFIPLFICLCFVSTPAFAHGGSRPVKKGILLVGFGTSVPGAEASLQNIEKLAKAAFPDTPIRMAYSSKKIRHKLAKQGKHIDSPAEALAKMADENFTHVAVQPLYSIPGEEYHNLLKTAHRFSGMPKGMKRVILGYPLMAQTEDMLAVRDAILDILPKERKADEAVVLMGHGTEHPGNIYYPGLQYFMSRKDPNVFVGTVEGTPSIEDVVADIQAKGIKKAYLIPLMAVAGDHAHNDMAGDEDDSWKSIMKKNSIEAEPILVGMGSRDNVAAIWIDHLKTAFAHFDEVK